ncbi:hypothetical protein H8F21_15610 [Pseudomonas sp. P66]|uniref:Restriction endonuclease n=1 Tax=Pseudomonas arcuscaelestis TaxID=2710591 RepID=A0ABS2BZI0_9PSED|nr:hypothetical protein [Pseudomonas arcuscaelestis]MBM5458994.1 hypothetical protein [Pseudomonas arcuscaelestis]
MQTIIAIIVVAGILYLALKAKAPRDIYKQFSLPANQWTIVGTDLGKGHPRKRLSALGVGGEPDAIFKGNRTGQIVVGEFKNRKYKGYVRRREYYQVILYIGLAREVFRASNVRGVLSFKDQCVQVPFDEALFQALIGIRAEVPISLKNRKPKDSRPLHKRMKISPGNQKIRFPR